jgi:hypothetical protein
MVRRGRRAASNPGEHGSKAPVVNQSSRVSLRPLFISGLAIPELKGGVCVSTVSIVCRRDRGSVADVVVGTNWSPRRLD